MNMINAIVLATFCLLYGAAITAPVAEKQHGKVSRAQETAQVVVFEVNHFVWNVCTEACFGDQLFVAVEVYVPGQGEKWGLHRLTMNDGAQTEHIIKHLFWPVFLAMLAVNMIVQIVTGALLAEICFYFFYPKRFILWLFGKIQYVREYRRKLKRAGEKMRDEALS